MSITTYFIGCHCKNNTTSIRRQRLECSFIPFQHKKCSCHSNAIAHDHQWLAFIILFMWESRINSEIKSFRINYLYRLLLTLFLRCNVYHRTKLLLLRIVIYYIIKLMSTKVQMIAKCNNCFSLDNTPANYFSCKSTFSLFLSI